ncbi:hypothetical protein [Lacinutrix cladophorae]
MKNTILLLLISILFLSCMKSLYNYNLEKKGIFNDEIQLKKIKKKDKHIVFFPIAHLGTKLFYNDVKSKVDSLNEDGYYFYFERVKLDVADSLLYRKFRKVVGMPYLKNGYIEIIDSTLQLKLKKELISQPSYDLLGLDSINSKNVDVSLDAMINYFEENHTEIILESCDFETSIFEKSTCDNQKRSDVFREEVIVNYRNNYVVKEVEQSSLKKIAIIYGAAHIPGIKKQLISIGYK